MRVWSLRLLAFAAVSTMAVLTGGNGGHAAATTFTVIAATDWDDSNPGNGICAGISGGIPRFALPCSLRAAITESNANPGVDTINFNIGQGIGGMFTIPITSDLPPISDPVTINGASQPPGASACGVLVRPCILVNGAGAGASHGLVVLAGNTTIRGLAIYGFNGHGIELVDGPNNTIAGNFIGTSDGVTDNGNTGTGVHVSSSDNAIGGTIPADRNVISGNQYGVYVTGASANNQVLGNYIGTTANGLAGLGNRYGIVFGPSTNTAIGGTAGTTPGGACTGACNVISGSAQSGILLGSSGTGVVIQGNYIGTNATGTAALPNLFYGITMVNSQAVQIGGTTPAARNVISGNDPSGINLQFANPDTIVHGNYIGTNAAGDQAVGNAVFGVKLISTNAGGNRVGGDGAGEGNLISGNGDAGVYVSLSTNSTVQGNIIGLNATGTGALPNLGSGIRMTISSDVLIGGDVAGARNVISGNGESGIQISRNDMDNPNGARLYGNYIGSDITGESAIPNAGPGVELLDISNNIIGGDTPGERNIISGNAGGVKIANTSVLYDSDDNVISGNYIGLDKDGAEPIPNTGSGISLDPGVAGTSISGTIIGGAGPGQGNVISSNTGNGVDIRATAGTADANMVLGNRIGTDAGGTAAMGNNFFGVSVNVGATNTVIDGNTIAANSVGVRIGDPTAGGTQITGNFIGTNESHDGGLGNLNEGVYLSNAQLTTIGGPDAGNTIWNNGAAGVRVQDIDAISNPISRNSIDNNAGEGIELNAGGNEEQAAPALTSAENGSTHIEGTFAGDPNTTYKIEFFASPACDPSGFGEGRDFIGDLLLLTDGSGDATIDVTLAPTTPTGQGVTATATSPTANTSEFSNCVTVTGSATATPTPTASPTTSATPSTPPTASPIASPTATPPAVLKGDANCDGEVGPEDLLDILEFIAGTSGPPDCWNEADADCSGDVAVHDAWLVLLYLGGMPQSVVDCPTVGDLA